jgi:hypothetical protein
LPNRGQQHKFSHRTYSWKISNKVVILSEVEGSAVALAVALPAA